ncbi:MULTISPECIES: beta-galactosidase [unclassified Rathayibacter]|uniref:beta-galactosidase n=1 Tax=unclassified Rathayibacter TaxID=2609250 RepID=UPI000F4BFF4E|nr:MULTISPECIES: beta-galactosidase [unclassified Rathayibacter]ROP48166.1 beta-galactosidase [Rathayibacter sp. PhB186]ROS48648.1 beta-galactosidase [Rathayibacter sp. PhB185]
MQHLTDRILFGAAYYHEYQPTSRLGRRDLAEDFRLMKAAGFTIVRVGESVWSTWEPENGVFELDWLQPVLDAAHEHGIAVVLGTPTYAAPMWLARLYPEINVERSSGRPMGWGARQEIDYSHPAFLFHAERLIQRIVERYAAHPAVIGFQVDNEPGNEIFHNRQVFQRFVDHLRARYGTVDTLNDEWGLTYWSHRLSTWADLWTPDANQQPQYDLAWRRFQASLTTDFIGWQADMVREITARAGRDDQFVTTCISYERRTVQDEELVRSLDIAAGNPYYRMQDGLELPDARVFDQHWTTSGTWALYATADRMYGSKQAPFLVTETDAQAIGMPWSNEPGYDGQWRQAAWALVSRGATMIEYWHWHTLHHGAETYWGGILPHSQEPGRVYEQIAALGADFAAAGDRVTELTPDSDVAILFSNESKWALEEYPSFSDPTQGTVAARGVPVASTRTFQTVFDSFARGAFDAGLQSNTVHPSQLTGTSPAAYAAAHPVLVAAAFTIADDAQLQWLEAYAAAGGHLVVGVRTGYEDEEARARLQRKPAFLDEAAGVHYDEFANLAVPLPVVAESGFPLPPGATATLWADGLQPDDAEVLVRYVHPHHGRFAAVTTRAHGAGRVTTVGTVPDLELVRALMSWAVGDAASGWRRATASQTVTSATNRHGERIRFVHNWSWEPSVYPLPAAATDVLTGAELPAGTELQLGPWDVRVLAADD